MKRGMILEVPGQPGRGSASVQVYDFRRPNKFSRDHVRAIQIVGETLARQLSTVLGTALRSIASVSLKSVDQFSYDEYVRSLSNPSYLAVLSLPPLAGVGLLQLDIGLALAIVDRLLGGTCDAQMKHRALTTIEEHLVRGVMERAMREFDYAFESLVRIETAIVRQESNPQFAQITAPSDMTVVLELDVRVAEERGRGSICVPYGSLQPVLESFESKSMFADRDPQRQVEFASGLRDALDDIPVTASVRFRSIHLTSGEVTSLRPGDVIPLHHGVGEPLTASVGDVPAFDAMVGANGKRLACRVVEKRSRFA